MFIYLFIRTSSDGRACVHRFVLIIVIACSFNAIIASLQLTGTLSTIDNSFLISGGFINPAECAGFTAAIIPLFLYLLNRKKTNRSALTITACISFILLVLLTKSRTAIIALSVTACVFYAYLNFHRVKKHIVLYACIAPFAFVAMFTLYQMRVQSVDGRFLIWKFFIKINNTFSPHRQSP